MPSSTPPPPHPPPLAAVRRCLLNAVLRTGSEQCLHCWGAAGLRGRESGPVVHGLNRRRMESCLWLWRAFKGAWAGQEPGCLNFSETSLWIVCGQSQLRWWFGGGMQFGGGGSGQSQLPLQVGLRPLVYLLRPCSLLSRPPMTVAGNHECPWCVGFSVCFFCLVLALLFICQCSAPSPCGCPLTQFGFLNFQSVSLPCVTFFLTTHSSPIFMLFCPSLSHEALFRKWLLNLFQKDLNTVVYRNTRIYFHSAKNVTAKYTSTYHNPDVVSYFCVIV